jgi:putative aminopeptidase FrvX
VIARIILSPKSPEKPTDRVLASGAAPLAIAITAHKHEIGTIVKSIGEAGKFEVRKLGDAYP